jgi:hypothetical protein
MGAASGGDHEVSTGSGRSDSSAAVFSGAANGGMTTDRKPSPLDRRWVVEVAYATVVLAATALILSIVGRRSGWPIGQAFNNELILVQLYAAHFRHLDLFPVWSTTDGLGLGTPVLLFYQKAFFYVSGVLFILFGGSLKPTLVVTIGLFLVVGAYGMRRALQLVTKSRALWVVGSVGFLFTNYVFTDWLVRGDLPEFSAMMIVPWLLFWCLELVKNRRVSLSLIVVLPLLVDAHSAIGLVAVFTLVIALATFVVEAGARGLRAVAPRLAVAVVGSVVLLAPTLLAEVRFAQTYDPATKVTHAATITSDFVDFWSYFYNDSYRWLASTMHLDLQIDFSLWIPILVAVVGGVVYWLVTRNDPSRVRLLRFIDLPSLVFLGGSLAVYLILQWRALLGVYRFLSPLEATDYPYRMLTFIVPLAVIVVVAMADSAVRWFPSSPWPKVVAAGWLLSLVLLSPITSTWSTQYGLLAGKNQFPSASLSAPPSRINYRTFKGIFSFNGILYDEYLPRVIEPGGQELYDDGHLYTTLHDHDYGAASLSGVSCNVVVPAHSPLESLQLTFTVSCARPTRLALPVSYNAYSSVFVVNAEKKLRRIPYERVPSDPRIIITVPSTRPEIVVVHLPTLWGVLS